jgi:hypothetical protein
MDKQGPQIGITSLAYPEQDLFTPTGVLTWNQSEAWQRSCRITQYLSWWRKPGFRVKYQGLADIVSVCHDRIQSVVR